MITTPFTFVATLNAILEAGATAVFADIREDDFNIDPESVAARITPRSKVLLPVHLYGQMADMDPLVGIAEANGLRILEDAAQSQGARYHGRGAGSYGLGTFSLYATKNMTTGEGGVITTDDDDLADRLRLLRNQGMRARYVYEMAGNNYRMTDLQAALGIPQLARYDDTISRRRRNAARLADGLDGVPGVIAPRPVDGREHVWHQFTIRVTPEAAVDRDTFVEQLREQRRRQRRLLSEARVRLRRVSHAPPRAHQRRARGPADRLAGHLAAGPPGPDRRRPRPHHRRRSRRGRSVRCPQ